ncbi:MAG TPA: serine/threonine-protein kinase [Gemmataceae bacterium]|nr:serine/threonine-protein kinase [Gemmataceae bacterium]
MLAPADLITFLARHQFLSSAQVEAVGRDRHRFASASQLCGDLVQRGWITPYQQAQLLGGTGDKLVIGSYRLLAPLGEGGMGIVYKAFQPKLDRTVALKIIRPQVLASRPEILSRFQREAKAIAQLNHPNVVILFDADEHNGTHFIAMEYVEGPTLEKMVRSQGPLAVRQAAEYIRQAALGLQHAFEVGLVHRDIKPSNILVAQRTPTGHTGRSSLRLSRPALVTPTTRSGSTARLPTGWGTVKVLDMGLARLTEGIDDGGGGAQEYTPLTRAGALLGTPDFIAPEQARDARTVTIKADIYSLGCTLYYLLTGKPPFPGGTDVQKLIRHQNEKPFPIEELRPGVPAELSKILARMLEKRPEDRYTTPQDLAEALDHYLAPVGPMPSAPAVSPVAETPPVADTPVPGPDGRSIDPAELPIAEPIDASIEETGATRMVEFPRPARESRPVCAFSAHTGAVGGVAVSGDGKLTATAGIDGRVRLWDTAGGAGREVAALPKPGAQFQCLAFAPDDSYLVAAGVMHGAAFFWRWDFRDTRQATEWGVYQGATSIPALAFSPDGRRLVAALGAHLIVWKIKGKTAGSGTVLRGTGHAIRAVAFSPDGRQFASVGDGKSVLIWSFGWFRPSARVRFRAAELMTSVAFSPDGRKLATAGLDRTVLVWDPDRSPVGAVSLAGHADNPRLVQFLDDGILLSVGEGGQAFLWDPAAGVKLHEYRLGRGVASAVAASPDGARVVVGGSDGKVSVFNTSRATVLTAVG